MNIRPILLSDAEKISTAFAEQGWNKPLEQYHSYYAKQEAGDFQVLVATVENVFAGYLILAPKSEHGPFINMNFPEIRDFNVLLKYQNRGIGSELMNCAETKAQKSSHTITLGVGLHSGYGAVQRLYIKRGYCPDGSGVWYQDYQLAPYLPCKNDDDLVLYLYKKFI